MTQPEKILETRILNWLNSLSDVFAFKINNNAVYDLKRKTFRKNNNPHIHNGIHDIIGLNKGRFFSIEVKIGYNKPTIVQNKFLKRVLGCDGVSFWTNNFEDCKKQFIRYFGTPKYKDKDVLFEEVF